MSVAVAQISVIYRYTRGVDLTGHTWGKTWGTPKERFHSGCSELKAGTTRINRPAVRLMI